MHSEKMQNSEAISRCLFIVSYCLLVWQGLARISLSCALWQVITSVFVVGLHFVGRGYPGNADAQILRATFLSPGSPHNSPRRGVSAVAKLTT